jgi:hypothetical protein
MCPQASNMAASATKMLSIFTMVNTVNGIGVNLAYSVN